MDLAAGARIVLRHELTRVTLALSAVAAAFTFPLVARISDALPGDLGDPLLNTFILAWGASRMPFAFSGVWTAPFFFPLKDTLALSEHLLGITIFTAPVVWITGNPVLAYNLAFLGSYVLAGAGMYLLARSLWGRRDAAFLAALAFAFAPHRVMHVPHLQVLFSGWMPIGLCGLHRYFQTGSRRALGVFAGAYALLALSNGYFLYFFAIAVVIVAVLLLGQSCVAEAGPARWPVTRRRAAELGAAALAVGAAITPAALAYARVRQSLGTHRSVSEIVSYSAAWRDYLRIPEHLWLWSGTLTVGDAERMLFPGFTVVALAALAAAALRRAPSASPATRSRNWTWNVVIYAAVLVAAVWLSGGPALPGPYGALLRWLPGFDGLRVAARFVVVASLALSVLASAGAAWLFGRLGPRAAAAAAVLLCAAVVLEGYGGPMAMESFRHDQRTRARLNDWLRRGRGGVLELPIAGPDLAPFTLTYQYNTVWHRRPIINGYTGYGYALQDFLGGPGSPFSEPEGIPGLLEALSGIGVRHVVLHPLEFSGQRGLGFPDPGPLVDALNRATGRAEPSARFYDALVWTLPDAPPRLPVDEPALSPIALAPADLTSSAMPDRLRFAIDGDLDTKWLSAAPQGGGEWIRVDLGRDADAGRVVILTNRFGVGDYPRGLAIESETPDGSRMGLRTVSVLPALVRGLASGRAGAPAVIDLPSNRTRALWIRQTGRSDRWQWAVHELQVFERRPGSEPGP
jgi:hypothetical protein